MTIRSITGWEVGGSGSGSCLLAGCNARSVEMSVSAITELVKDIGCQDGRRM